MTLYEVLSALGTTAGDIVRTLRSKGIHGERRSVCGCPIARYLRTLGFVDVRIDSTLNEVWARGCGPYIAVMPTPVHTFVSEFDEGKWPEFDMYA